MVKRDAAAKAVARAAGNSTLTTGARHLRQIIAGMTDGVILVGTDQMILWANPHALAMHGVERVADLGATVTEFRHRFVLHHGDRRPLPDGSYPMERLQGGETFDEVIVEVSPKGEQDVRWVHRIRSLVLTDDDGRPDCLALILEDETELYQAEERFERFFHANPAPAAILCLADLRFTRINDGFKEMTGYRDEQVVGRSIYEVDVLEGAARRELAIERLKVGRTVPQMEAMLQLPSGGERGVIVAGQPIEVGGAECMLFTFADLHERHEAEAALRKSEERFEIAFRMAPVPTLVARRDGFRVLLVNDAFEAVTGFGKEEAVGRTAAEMPLWADKAAGDNIEKALRKAGRVRDLRVPLRTKKGDVLDCMVSAEVVEIGHEVSVLLVAQNVTDRNRTHVEVAGAIEAVMKDTAWFTDVVLDKLARTRRLESDGAGTAGAASLPPRAREVLDLVCLGMGDDRIAERLEVSRNTVRNHVSSLYKKTGVKSRAELIVWARERGITGRKR